MASSGGGGRGAAPQPPFGPALLGAVFPDCILIGFQPVIPANVTLFSDKSCFAYEIPCDHCSCLFGW